MMHDEKAFDIARQVRKLVLATVEVHDDMEHRLELEESLYLALADYCQQQATLARGFLDAAITSRKLRDHSTEAPKGIIRRGDRSEKAPGTIRARGFSFACADPMDLLRPAAGSGGRHGAEKSR
jgi:hypothetical protein